MTAPATLNEVTGPARPVTKVDDGAVAIPRNAADVIIADRQQEYKYDPNDTYHGPVLMTFDEILVELALYAAGRAAAAVVEYPTELQTIRRARFAMEIDKVCAPRRAVDLSDTHQNIADAEAARDHYLHQLTPSRDANGGPDWNFGSPEWFAACPEIPFDTASDEETPII
jgi:hypothetical protein